MKVEASLNNLKMTPRKVRLVAYAVRGLGVGEALVQFDKMLKKASLPLTKLLQSAIANAEHNFSLDRNNLFVEDVWVGEGQKLKRWTPRAQGRATPLWRRMSKIRIVLAEREEGKIVKKKKTTVKKEATEVKDAVVEEGKSASIKKTGKTLPQKAITHGKTRGAGFTKKTFQRKAV
ncbi:MAG: 50S ribosomal protein L22 [Candidatus Moranbacteria bacterium]|nr:50S ribosomal protein L22 [Candidatus Moranbacteria bacterium]